jgi:hypothetical protein
MRLMDKQGSFYKQKNTGARPEDRAPAEQIDLGSLAPKSVSAH